MNKFSNLPTFYGCNNKIWKSSKPICEFLNTIDMLIYVHIRDERQGVGQCWLPDSLMTGWFWKWGQGLFLFPIILQVKQLHAQEENKDHSWSHSREVRLEPKATNASSNYCSIFHSLTQTGRWTAHKEAPSVPGQLPWKQALQCTGSLHFPCNMTSINKLKLLQPHW